MRIAIHISFLVCLLMLSCRSSAVEKNNSILPAMDLSPSVENITDSSATFVVSAKRNLLIPKEYFPNSEKIRVEIFNKQNKLKYNSSMNKVFMQVIADVLPIQIGETYIYRYYWDGRDNAGNQLSPGEYRVNITLPAKPKPYTCSLNFKWKIK